MSDRHLGVTIYLTAIIALVLTVLPLPTWFAIARPQFLVLTVLYWSTMRPRSGGLFLGWSSGLALDVFQGSLLGEHALALAFTTYLAIRLNLLVRAKPLFEQSLFVFAALMGYEFLRADAMGTYAHRRAHLAPRGRRDGSIRRLTLRLLTQAKLSS
jgi:rod shape-determining protein MreD